MQRIALIAALCLAAPVQALAQDADAAAGARFRATTLDLSARGEVRAPPDRAMVGLGVVTDGATATAAMQANAQRMAGVMAALRRAGVPEKDIQTSGLALSPQYAYKENQPPSLTGYQASNQVAVTVRDLARLGQTIDAVVQGGGNQVNGVSFGLSDPTAAENAARNAAAAALAAKAELYARATGHRVLRLVSLSEGGGYAPRPVMAPMAMMKREAAQDATSVSPGELTVRIDVSAVYELAR